MSSIGVTSLAGRTACAVALLLCVPFPPPALAARTWLASSPPASPTYTLLGAGTRLSGGTSAGATPSDRLGETETTKSYLVPAVEIVSFLALLNAYDRVAYGDGTYAVGPDTFWHHLDGPWEFDQNAFTTNQFLHPYQGSMYHGFARSAGLSFWESMAYTFGGSLLWELGGETSSPSINDQFATGIGGSFLGEPLRRIASLVLDGGGDSPSLWRELAAAAIAPPTGVNRTLFGDRFDRGRPRRDPAVFAFARVGASLTVERPTVGESRTIRKSEAIGDASVAYGLPGKPGYEYREPFDYFQFDFRAIAGSNPFENVTTRGLLYGNRYSLGDDYRGIWGLYGSFDYISPHVFRVSSTAVSVGTTAQRWLSPKTALQGTALGGVGFAAAGVSAQRGDRDYHYGATPQGLLALRLILGETAMLDGTLREYYVSSVAGTEPRGTENIARGEFSLTLRLFGHQAISVQYLVSRRDADYPHQPGKHQTVQAVGLAFTVLSDAGFGAVDWRSR